MAAIFYIWEKMAAIISQLSKPDKPFVVWIKLIEVWDDKEM